jgi:branched-chain amino acid aminotransferase
MTWLQNCRAGASPAVLKIGNRERLPYKNIGAIRAIPGSKMLQKFDERNRDLIVNINGQLIHRDKAGISPFDSAVQGGDAVWEGLRLYRGRIFKLHEHLDRLHRSATALSFAEIPPREKIIEEIKRTLAANKMRDGVHIRLTLTRGLKITSGMDPRLNQSGSTLIILAEHKAPVYTKTGLTLITSKIRRPSPKILDCKIHHANLLNSILAKIEANNAAADDALMLDTRGFVAETNATHVFIVRKGEVVTSRVLACPEGITRATVIEICAAEKIRCIESDLWPVDVYGADEIFCTGTMGELAGVIKIDNRIIGDGKVGPMTKRLSELYAKRTASEGVEVIVAL